MSLLQSLFPPSIAPKDAEGLLRRREAVLLDVREPVEWRAGRAPGARNVPLSGLRAGDLDAGRRYVAVCRSGNRSRAATARLRKAGLDVLNLKGGMLGWERAGLPLEPRRGRVV